MNADVKALILAAGRGTRLQSDGVDLPKVLRSAAGQPLLHHVLSALSFLPRENTILVVGWMKEKVLSAFPGYPHAVQEQLNGTGGAVQFAASLLTNPDGHVLICCGDAPLMRRETFEALVAEHLRRQNACTLLSARLPNGGSYGRILRGEDGAFRSIVEARDCTPAQQAITEVNTGTYVFRVRDLLACLDRLSADNAQGELYLTDVPALILSDGGQVGLCDTCSAREMLGVNTPEQLAQVEAILREEQV